jgi:N-6 DNA Methylase
VNLEGQEKDVTTAGLARMNMILHDFSTTSIFSGNTVTASLAELEEDHGGEEGFFGMLEKVNKVEVLAARVAGHLKRMGFASDLT